MNQSDEVRVTLQVQEPFGRVRQYTLPVARSVWDEACRSMDSPKSDTDVFTELLFCTDPAERRRIHDMRRAIASLIADNLVRMMSERDTVMGCKP